MISGLVAAVIVLVSDLTLRHFGVEVSEAILITSKKNYFNAIKSELIR